MSCLQGILLTLVAITITACSFVTPIKDPSTSSDRPLKAIKQFAAADNGLFCRPYIEPGSSDVLQVYPPSPPLDLWQRIRDGFQLDLTIENQRIEAQLNWYKSHPDYLHRVSNRAELYMFHIVEKLEERGMPLELALLPIVESAFDPFAYSHGRAAGMWQFIPGTGRVYGLEQNWWYDGRRDVIASTDAALTYLDKLNRHFDGDWLHALASYNSGEGKVARAIDTNRRKGRDIDFWSLDLPRETEAYVPKLIALGKLLADPERYGIEWPAIANEPNFATVDIGSQLDLVQAATLAGTGIEEIYRLNPGFNRWATAPDGPHILLVPIDKASQFKTGLTELSESQRIGWRRYTIRSGDSLLSIAKKFDTQVSVIRKTNHIRGNTIRAGKALMVPVAQAPLENYELSAAQRLQKIQTRPPNNDNANDNKRQRIRYTVRNGDSFWSISRHYAVSVRELSKWNGMAPADVLRPGQELSIWVMPQRMATVKQTSSQVAQLMSRDAMIRKVGYKVRSGDSLALIADKFNLSVHDIIKWNTLDSSRYLQPGQALTLYVDVMNSY